jgi:prepilin-type N-terminal cleavage/methylation domain-containing protein
MVDLLMNGGRRFMRLQEGFTLIEVLIALMILSFVALGIAGLFSHAMLVNASGHDYAVLASEARFALEALQARPFEDAALLATAGTPRAWAPVTRDFTIEYTVDDYFVQNWAEVSSGVWPAPGTNTPNLKRISMTVSSTNQVLKGRRVLTVSSLKIPG